MKAKPVKFSLRRLSERDAKRLTFILIPVLVVIIIIAALFPLLGSTAEPYEATTYAMGSYVQQTVYGDRGEEAAAEAASAVQLLDNAISWRTDGSDTQSINLNAGLDWIEVGEDTANLLALAKDVAEKSGGAFDVTIAPISWLWAFDDAPTAPPSAEKIAELLPNVGNDFLRVDGASVSLKNRGNAIDLGGIGKGAACDAAVQVYEAAGVRAAVVAVGGSVGVYGTKPAGGAWNIAVRDPETSGALGTLSVDAGFLSTSGSYEKTFEAGGTTYHHLLDPATGYPAESGLVSVTVLSSGGALSDALSTACFVLGLERGTALLEAYDASGIFIDENKQITVTGGLSGRFSLTADGYTILGGNA